MSEPPFPPSGHYLPAIRESTQKLCDKSKILIETKNIERLLLSDTFTSSLGRLTTLPGVALPLKFASHLDELNVLSILALLNFGSSFDVPLRTQTGHGASNAIKAFIFSMYLTSNPSEGDFLSAQGMQSISPAKVAELMAVNVHIEKSHSTIPGVVLGELGGPVYQFVQLVTGVLNETGKILQESGYPNLGLLVVEALKEGEKVKSNQTPSAEADAVIEKLVRALPPFRDMALVDGEPVYIFSKVIFLLNIISIRFGSISPPPFPIPAVTELPVSADGNNTSILAHLGIVNVSSAPTLKALWHAFPNHGVQGLFSQTNDGAAHTPDQEGPTAERHQAFRLRAATIAAYQKFSEVARSEKVAGISPDVTVPRINVWIQGIARERPDYKALGRLVVKNDIFF